MEVLWLDEMAGWTALLGKGCDCCLFATPLLGGCEVSQGLVNKSARCRVSDAEVTSPTCLYRKNRSKHAQERSHCMENMFRVGNCLVLRPKISNTQKSESKQESRLLPSHDMPRPRRSEITKTTSEGKVYPQPTHKWRSFQPPIHSRSETAGSP